MNIEYIIGNIIEYIIRTDNTTSSKEYNNKNL